MPFWNILRMQNYAKESKEWAWVTGLGARPFSRISIRNVFFDRSSIKLALISGNVTCSCANAFLLFSPWTGLPWLWLLTDGFCTSPKRCPYTWVSRRWVKRRCRTSAGLPDRHVPTGPATKSLNVVSSFIASSAPYYRIIDRFWAFTVNLL